MKNPRHTIYRDDGNMVEYKFGNTTIIRNTSDSSPEESAQAEYDLHMAARAIIEEAWEKGGEI